MTNSNLEPRPASTLDIAEGWPAEIDEAIVEKLFEGKDFHGVADIIDPAAHQTGMRHVFLDPVHRIFQFDIWHDPSGSQRTKRLRTELGAIDMTGSVEVRDYEPNGNGKYVLRKVNGKPIEGEVIDDKQDKEKE